MPATFTIYTDPIGSQYVETIGSNDPDDLNDFPVIISADENVDGREVAKSVDPHLVNMDQQNLSSGSYRRSRQR